MTEDKLWKTILQDYFASRGLYTQRIEHHLIPDVYITKDNACIWVELKCINKVQGILKPDWRPGQLAWMMAQRVFCGTNNFVLALYYNGEVYFLPPQKQYPKEALWNNKKQHPKNYLNQTITRLTKTC